MSLLGLVLLFLILIILLKFSKPTISRFLKLIGLVTPDLLENPFLGDSRLPIKPLVIDQKCRDAVLKQNFKKSKIPDNLDVIIIGSGIGGLSTGALLSKVGKKVLILEQHDQAGGTCHTFIEKGYEFDVGIHYIGEMHFQSLTKTYLDQISDGQIQWEKLDEEFDKIVFKFENEEPKKYSIIGNVEKQKSNLKAKFPGEEAAIDKYYAIVNEIHLSYTQSMYVKFMPLWLVNLLDYSGLIKWITNYYTWNKQTIKEVINKLTKNQFLRDIFCYCYLDFGTVPSDAGFPMQALLTSHFSNGASYPVGGASEIAHNIIPVIERGGGKVLVNAKVFEILLGPNGEANGVKVFHGAQQYEIFAPIIISNAGIYNTFERFLPQEIAVKSKFHQFIQFKHGIGATSIFVGLDSTADILDVPIKKNYWVFMKKDIDKSVLDYIGISKEECEIADVPILFISFPSTKDPSWEKRYPGKTTMAIIMLSNYEWFQDWEKKSCKHRGDDYEAVKKTLGWKAINHAIDLFPKIKDHIDYVNIGTPLSNNFYLGSPKGEIYGMDHSQNRFSLMNNAILRPKTDIAGLYLTGQDIATCGFTGALWGGMLCAQQVLSKNIVSNLTEIHAQLKKETKKSD